MSDFIAVQNSSVRHCKSRKDNRGTRVAKFTSQCFLCLSFYFISLITLNKPCNLIGCFVLGFTSHWLGKRCNSEQKIKRFVHKTSANRIARITNRCNSLFNFYLYTNLFIHICVSTYDLSECFLWNKFVIVEERKQEPLSASIVLFEACCPNFCKKRPINFGKATEAEFEGRKV